MKRIVWAIMLGLAVAAGAADPRVGDSRENVVYELGNPKGWMTVGHGEIMIYDRGTIYLGNGKVTAVNLITPMQLAERQAAEAEAQRIAEARRKQLMAEGAVEREKMLADPAFTNKPPSDQLAVWKEFAAKYPGVDVSEQLGSSEQAVQEEEQQRAEAARTAEIARLKQLEEQKPPPLSSSKLRRYYRSHGSQGKTQP